MSLSVQLAACFYRYKIQLNRFKRSMLGLLLSPIISGVLIYMLRDNLKNPDYSLFGYLVMILVGNSFNGYVRVTIGDVVNERKEKLKELMIMNGLSSFSYNMGVLIVAIMKAALMGLPIILSFAFITTIPQVLAFYGIFIVSALAYAPLTLTLSTFFSSPKLAIQVGGIFFSLQSFAFLLGQRQKTLGVNILVSLLPSTPMALMTADVLGANTSIPGYNFLIGFSMLIFDAILYYLLFLYFDAVIPMEGEVKKSYCFCLRRRRTTEVEPLNDSEQVISKMNIELKDSLVPNAKLSPYGPDFSSALYHEEIPGIEQRHKNLAVRNLRKIFNGVAVVDGVSLCMYEREIFCLLGHNGAGKTTTINMLTGILRNDGGEVNYDGRDFSDDFESIRLNIGLCAQKDILFHYLTVREHLRFFGLVRGIGEPELSNIIAMLLQKCHLTSEADKLAPTLSGGNKRKLSLAISLIGNPKVIFLDEPTSGMDPNTRRGIWDILKALREEGRTIVLTTHHLDEADELSNRIGVLTRGKLFCVGSSEFIKKKFGVGYHLVLTHKEEQISLGANNTSTPEHIANLVQSSIPSAVRVEDSAPGVQKFLLPFTEQDRFAKLFTELEGHQNVKVSLEMNSLEDAFINIGLEEEKYLAKIANPNDVSIQTEEVQIKAPDSINHNPRYVFWDQFTALLMRKFFQTVRNTENMFFYFSPLLFIIFGFLYTSVLGTDTSGATGDLVKAIQLLIYTLLGFSLSSSIYMFLIVKEKQDNVKYMLKVMGCRTLPYWVGSFVADAIIALGVAAVVVLFTYIYDIKGLNQQIFFFYIFVYGYSLNLIAMAYFWSWMYSNAVSSQKYFGLFATFLLWMLPYIPCWIWADKAIGAPLRYLSYVLSPMSTFFDASLCLAIIIPYGSQGVSQIPYIWSKPWYYIIVMVVMTLLYLGATIVIDSWRYNLRPQQVQPSQFLVGPDLVADQQAIIAEEQRVGNPASQDLVKLVHMNKVYSNGFTAVKDVTFGVKKKEIFGLLGPNGAGKSTTFNVMTAMIPRTGGSVQLLNREVDRNIYDVFKNVGVCPQFNPLWGNLTVKEHLQIFGLMKGLHGQELEENINYFKDILSLAEHFKKKADHLSGGNKRKLCVILALLGAPQIQFLDEPSTGLDPIAKKFLWKSLTDNLNQREASIVLTTHSMGEAENLCSRIAIMINGRFVCLGPVEELKAKFGQGYKITLTKVSLAQPSLVDIVRSFAPQAIEVPEASQSNQTFQIPSHNFSFSKAFSFLETMKTQGQIKDFSIYNTTLEQVFIQFSRFQIQYEQPQSTNNDADLPRDLQV